MFTNDYLYVSIRRFVCLQTKVFMFPNDCLYIFKRWFVFLQTTRRFVFLGTSVCIFTNNVLIQVVCMFATWFVWNQRFGTVQFTNYNKYKDPVSRILDRMDPESWSVSLFVDTLNCSQKNQKRIYMKELFTLNSLNSRTLKMGKVSGP